MCNYFWRTMTSNLSMLTRKISLSLFLFFLVTTSATAQVQYSGWVASFNTFRINKDFSLHFDAQVRSTNHIDYVQTVLLRPGINYHINKKLTATAGYAYIPNRRSAAGITELVAEHRAWEQLLLAQKAGKVSIAHRLRFEQRFMPKVHAEGDQLKVDEYAHAYRLRYFTRAVIPLTGKQPFNKGCFAALQDEVFANTGNTSVVNGKFFDQNRFYVAFGYRFPQKIDIEAGYMNQYVSLANAMRLNNHIAQVAVYKRL